MYRFALIDKMKTANEVIVYGDGRFNSMSHSAKYGEYTIFCSNTRKIVHFEISQVFFEIPLICREIFQAVTLKK